MHMNKNIITLTILAAAFCAAANLQAQDKQTLDLLVSKGLISRAEADTVAKKSATVIKPNQKGIKSMKLEGRLQVQYEYLDNNDAGTDPKSTFLLRRIFLGMGADLGGGWKANIVADFANEKSDYIEKAHISKEFDGDIFNGTADFGYKKINFAVEEYESSSKLWTVERSLATRYFAEGADKRKLGLAGRHTGVFWNGKVNQLKGLYYGASVSTAYNNSPIGVPEGYTNNLMYTANAAYKAKFDCGKIEVGANLAYTNGTNVMGKDGYRYGDMFGFNPYIKASIMGLDIWGELLMAHVENGISDGVNATPMGANLGFEYKFDAGDLGQIAPTVRLSWLDTDGRGVKISDGVRDSNATNTFDRGKSIYVGLNWYINGNAIKYQLGYEYARFEGGHNSAFSSADANAFRTQIQILF